MLVRCLIPFLNCTCIMWLAACGGGGGPTALGTSVPPEVEDGAPTDDGGSGGDGDVTDGGDTDGGGNTDGGDNTDGSGGNTDGGGNTDSGGGTDGGGEVLSGGTVQQPNPVRLFTAPTAQEANYFLTTLPAELDAVQNSFNMGGRTQFSALPGGAITYDGFMVVSFASTPNADITSAAQLTVNLDNGATTGGASQFMGFVYNSDTDTQELARYAGGITFQGATLTGDPNGNANIDLAINGSFDNGAQQLTLTGNIDGPIYGANGSGIFASGSDFGFDPDLTLTADNVPVYGQATLWGVSTSQ